MRPTWPQYFMMLADVVKLRSTCLRRQIGAIAVETGTNRVLTTGYNGPPPGIDHCVECIREQMKIPSGEREEMCRAVHAEANVVVQAARHGISLNGATLYCTTFPCASCAKLLISAGICRVVYRESYPSDLSKELFKKSNVVLHYEGTKL